jgi:outer membrane receptor protein involved in Fe transport
MHSIRNAPRSGVSRRFITSTIAMAVSAAITSGTALAQSAPSDAGLADEVVVTGTRIVRDGYTAPTPVTVVATEELARVAPSSIPDALNQLPQFAGSSNNTANRGGTATNPSTGNYLSLRNLGPIRTLVLLDGQRLPPTSFDGTVDANIIPASLVSRIDVVTGGASAAYGSDAVSGVINFVLDNRFNGVKALAQAGESDYGDGQSQKYSLAAGTGFNGDRGHVLLAYDHYNVDGIKDPLQRPLGQLLITRTGAGTVANPYIDSSGVVINTATYGTLFQGVGTVNAGNPYRNFFFQPGGAIAPFNIGRVTGTTNFSIGGDGVPTVGRTLTGTQKTDQVFGRIDYALTDGIDAFAQVTYAKNFNSYVSVGSGVQTGDFRISADNAFLPDTVRTTLQACGAPCAFTVAGRIHADQPYKLAQFYGSASTIMAGLKGKVSDYNWRVGYARGNTLLNVSHAGNFENAHWYAALDAVRDTAAYRTSLGAALAPGLAAPQGNIVCRITLTNPTLQPNCVPINIFGQNSPSAAAWAYVSQISRYRVEQHMDIVNADISGDLFNLPAGPVSWAVGAEYRKQNLDQTSNNDPSTGINTTGLRTNVNAFILTYNSTNVGTAFGDQNVKEAFLEVAVPVLKQSAIGTLDLNGAFRHTDYSTSGGVNTWKFGVSYSPIDQLRFRATTSRDIRAPNLFELFAGKQATRGPVNDPHTLGPVNNLNAITYSQGNPLLKPEKSDTLTAGVVWMPTFASGLSTSVDFFSIDIKGAIGTLATADLLQQCELSGGTSSICNFIQRPLPFSDRTLANFPLSVSAIPFNQASQKVNGIDYEFGYRLPLGAKFFGPSNLVVRLLGTHLLKYDVQSVAGGTVISSNNTVGNSGVNIGGVNTQNNNKNRFNLSVSYSDGPVELTLQGRYFGAADRTQVPGVIYTNNDVPAVKYYDVTLNYSPDFGDKKIEGFFTVNNLTNKQPPIVVTGGQPGQQYPTNVFIYDVIGRYFTAGIRARF